MPMIAILRLRAALLVRPPPCSCGLPPPSAVRLALPATPSSFQQATPAVRGVASKCIFYEFSERQAFPHWRAAEPLLPLVTCDHKRRRIVSSPRTTTTKTFEHKNMSGFYLAFALTVFGMLLYHLSQKSVPAET